METIKSLFFKPDPQTQLRNCNRLIRTNKRKLSRDVAAMAATERKAQALAVAAARRGERDPARSEQAAREARGFARELLRARRQSARLATASAQLASVEMQVNEAFAMRRIEGSIRTSVAVMRDVRSLTSLPQLDATMRELGVELLKAGVIDDMVGDMLPANDDLELEGPEADLEVDKVLGEILKTAASAQPTPAAATPLPPEATPALPSAPVREAAAVPLPPAREHEEDDEEDAEAMMDQMRDRLEALRS